LKFVKTAAVVIMIAVGRLAQRLARLVYTE
jgi:hypothetical protein